MASPTFEAAVWAPVKDGWKQLYGSFPEAGVSVENHEFQAKEPLDWGASFHRDSLELCLNWKGTGTVRKPGCETCFKTHTVGFYCCSDRELSADRASGQLHSFITVEFSRSYVASQVFNLEHALHPALRSWIGERTSPELGAVGVMSPAQELTFQALRQPPVPPAAQKLWYQAKILELLAQIAFTPVTQDEFFCQRQKRVSRERVERVIMILRERLADPPDMESLGAEVGCSSFYLSRTFSKETGRTIPQFLRQVRMERAAELLLAGRHNVTEAAMEVGYSSLSHFSKAFCETYGCCPALFPSAPALVEKFRVQRARQNGSSWAV
jgi:AraC-like DNA-binding protein